MLHRSQSNQRPSLGRAALCLKLVEWNIPVKLVEEITEREAFRGSPMTFTLEAVIKVEEEGDIFLMNKMHLASARTTVDCGVGVIFTAGFNPGRRGRVNHKTTPGEGKTE